MLKPTLRTLIICFASQALYAAPKQITTDSIPLSTEQTTTDSITWGTEINNPAFAALSFYRANPDFNSTDKLKLLTSDSFPRLSPQTLDFQQRKKEFARSLRIALPLIAAGALANSNISVINKFEVREERIEHFPNIKTKVDNYLLYAPIAAVYTMDLLGYKGRHNLGGQTALLLKSQLIMTAIVAPLKKFSHVLRPDGTTYNSFPSGHTSQAFLSAEFLRIEYGKEHPMLALGGYLVAGSVGALRILKDRHWVSDVIAGAGVGILSVNLANLTQKGNWPFNGKKKLSILPTYNGSGPGLYMSYSLSK